MIKLGKGTYQQLKEKFRIKSPWDLIIIFALNILITIPVFIIAHQNLITLDWAHHIDRILLFLLILFIFQVILRAMRRITLISVILYLIILVIGTLFGDYTFQTVFEDYRSMIYTMNDDPYPQDIIISKLLPFPNKSKIIDAVEYQNPKVRDFAIMAINKHFKHVKGYNEDWTLIQSFAIFKEINSRWNYVSDPKGHDYIAKATESLKYLSGDCDDHSVLMAACIKAIGGTTRLIHTKGHIYPELYIGTKKDLERINYAIKKELFPTESKGKKIHYHIDERGKIWLNLDYTAKYPGGPFMHEEILGALTLD
ncbi:transglutaminase domain-containing protein [Flavobacterium phycosphaerae]|uniref:transglutaminase domain-containing protein n=1 Tax=Flavobacterium phycosphaerae TaxID=2697515 RepID=UPI001389837B|nr:transglutaminase domain-containing protein [Flavobacterium phycosphaerae]